MKKNNISALFLLIFGVTTGCVAGEEENEALWTAVVLGDIGRVQEALRADAAVNADIKAPKVFVGQTALMRAAYDGHVAIVRLLLKAGANVNAKDREGSTALLSAATRGHVEIVRLLLKASADVNAKNEYGNTALYSAALFNHIEIVQLLLKAGADILAKNGHGSTVLEMTRNPEVRKVIQDFFDALNPSLLAAAYHASYDGVTKALKQGAKVDAKDEKGNTALHLVAGVSKITAKDISRRLDRAALITRLLLSRHASLVKNNAGETAVYIALALPDSPLVKVYEEYAAKRPDIQKALEEAHKQHKEEAKQDYEEMEKAYPGNNGMVIKKQLAAHEAAQKKKEED